MWKQRDTWRWGHEPLEHLLEARREAGHQHQLALPQLMVEVAPCSCIHCHCQTQSHVYGTAITHSAIRQHWVTSASAFLHQLMRVGPARQRALLQHDARLQPGPQVSSGFVQGMHDISGSTPVLQADSNAALPMSMLTRPT